MKKITTIIFDLGGVILNNDWHDGNQTKFEQYSKVFGITYDDMERGWNSAWSEYRLGKVSEDIFWNNFLTEAGAKPINVDKAKELWRKNITQNESMLALIKKLKKDYKLALLTTIGKEWLNFKTAKYNFDAYFDVTVSSGFSGLAKPDPEIYKMTLNKLSVNSNECLFIDDYASDLIPAKELGIETILFTSQKELEEKLKEYGVL